MARPGIRVTCNAVIALLLCLMATPVNGETDGGTPRAENPAPPSLIQFQQGRLRVRLHHASWDQVLHAIERQTGVVIHVKEPLVGTVTQAFDDLPLEQGLRRLFQNAHVVMFYKGGTEARVSHVWLVPKAANTPPTDAPVSADAVVENRHEPDERQTALQRFATQGNLEGLQQALIDPDQNIQAMALDLLRGWGPQGIIEALLHAAASGQPATRVRALILLQETDLGQERTVLSALAQALTDPDVTVKAYALHALAERGGSDAVGAMHLSLQDPDVSFRMMVIEEAARTEKGGNLLQEALSNDDDTIRALAAFWLEEAASKER